ncbi:MAG TPA: hypothetical protein VF885_19550 [Arthrobacter sp.]
MTQLIMAAALLLLAAARIPAMRRTGKDAVFLAAAFAGASSLLLSPLVYIPVDTAVGGINLTKLVLNSLMMVGLWYLRAAILAAVSPDADTRPLWLQRLPLLIALAVQAAAFFLAGLSATTTVWAGNGDHPLPTAIFAITLVAFVAWSCGEITWTCFRYVPRMRSAFRIGFSMVGTGALLAVLTMLKMSIDVLGTAVPSLYPFEGDLAHTNYAPLEMAAVTLVGIGLTIPALAGRADRARAAGAERLALEKVRPIWDRVLKDADMERMLKSDDAAAPAEQLHRMLIEIWDADLAVGPRRSALTTEDREYLLSVEAFLDKSPAAAK